jgi:hypothetical protein
MAHCQSGSSIPFSSHSRYTYSSSSHGLLLRGAQQISSANYTDACSCSIVVSLLAAMWHLVICAPACTLGPANRTTTFGSYKENEFLVKEKQLVEVPRAKEKALEDKPLKHYNVPE